MKKHILLTVPKQHKARPKSWAIWNNMPFKSTNNKGEKNKIAKKG